MASFHCSSPIVEVKNCFAIPRADKDGVVIQLLTTKIQLAEMFNCSVDDISDVLDEPIKSMLNTQEFFLTVPHFLQDFGKMLKIKD